MGSGMRHYWYENGILYWKWVWDSRSFAFCTRVLHFEAGVVWYIFALRIFKTPLQLRQAQLFSGSKVVHAWCFEIILVKYCYIIV